MRRRESGLIDMTPLLDVVFILLFALILNVNVSKAQDQKEAQAREDVLTSELKAKESEVLSARADLLDIKDKLNQSGEDAADLIEQLLASEEAFQGRGEVLEAYSKALAIRLNKEIALSENDLPEDWQVSDAEAEVLVEEWLKYQQIGERYLFVDLSISHTDGRIYLDETYTGVNMEVTALADDVTRNALKEDLQYYIYDWLDHKAGGYTFVFVSVMTDKEVKRAVVETVFDSLQGLQTSFEKDRYLINRFVTYE